MTDIVGSTKLWERDRVRMADALEYHDRVVAESAAEFESNAPRERGEGDSAFIVCPTVTAACSTAHRIISRLLEFEDPEWRLSVRCAIHTGEVLGRDGQIHGPMINRCARIRAVVHGGQVLLSEAAAAQARDSLAREYGLSDLGVARLKDLMRPERLFQLLHPSLNRDYPPPASLDRTPNNLPIQLTSFTGREADLAEVRRLLEERRQVTLLGAGGVGKTRLALQAAAEGIDEYVDGAWFVDLSQARTEEELLRAMETGLRLPGPRSSAELVGAISNQRRLIILDNCEQVVEPARYMAHAILTGAPDCKLLVTSRQALGYSGEQTYIVKGLSLPESPGGLKEVLGSEAANLLAERARLKSPTFHINDANAEWVGKIVKRLEGMPLPIELAAPRLQLMSAEALFGRLAHFFRALSAAPVGSVNRHQTVHAAIEWSYDLLDPEERLMFRALSLLPGGWRLTDLDSIAEHLGLAEVSLALAERLVDKSMAITDEAGVGMRMLVPIREFGSALVDQDSSRVRRAVMSWCHEQCLKGHAAGSSAELLSPEEFQNYGSALDAAIEERDLSISAAIMRCLFRTWMSLGLIGEARNTLRRLLPFMETGQPADRASIARFRGTLAWAQNDLDEAESCLKDSVSISESLGDERETAAAKSNLGLVLASRERWPEAEKTLQEALESFRKLENEINVGRLSTNLGNLLFEQGRHEEAKQLLEAGLAIGEKLSDRLTEQTTLRVLAQIAAATRQFSDASRLVRRAISLGLALQDSLGVAQTLVVAASLLLARGADELAAQAISAASSTFQSANYRTGPRASRELQSLRDQLGSTLSEAQWRKNESQGRALGALGMAQNLMTTL